METGRRIRSRLARVAAAAVIAGSASMAVNIGHAIGSGYPGMPGGCAVAAAPRHPVALSPADAQREANRAYSSLLRCFSVDGNQFRGEYGPFTTVWPDSWAIQSMMSLYSTPHPPPGLARQIRDRIDGLARYWGRGPGAPGYHPGIPVLGGTRSYNNMDDNNWVALLLLDAHEHWPRRSYVRQAEKVFHLDVSEWQGRAHPDPGGVRWTQNPDNTMRATVSTATAATLGARLYGITGNRDYLAWSLRMLRWINHSLERPNGLWGDNIDPAGRVVPVEWSYNQGEMMGAYTALFHATGNQRYRRQAIAIADRTVSAYTHNTGIDFSNRAFNGRFAQYLGGVYALAPKPEYLRVLRGLAERVARETNAATGVASTHNRKQLLLEQAAAVQLFSTYAAHGRGLTHDRRALGA